VADDYSLRISQGISKSSQVYKEEVAKIIKHDFGITTQAENLLTCNQNDTAFECPINKNQKAKEFLVVVHNQQSRENTQLVRIRVPNANYKVQSWSKRSNSFADAPHDLLEQSTFTKTG
jgi:uncharacterized protein